MGHRKRLLKAIACLGAPPAALNVATGVAYQPGELRASISLARLWRGQCKFYEARELLSSVYDGFTEGFDTRDLMEARTLLIELQSS